MGPIHLFELVSRHNSWLSVRQSTIAGNVANANTPGFRALDVQSFESAMESTKLAMAATSASHMTAAGGHVPTTEVGKEEPWEILHSGNTVSLEQELMKAGDVNRSHRLNTSVVKAFHRMLMASAKA